MERTPINTRCVLYAGLMGTIQLSLHRDKDLSIFKRVPVFYYKQNMYQFHERSLLMNIHWNDSCLCEFFSATRIMISKSMRYFIRQWLYGYSDSMNWNWNHLPLPPFNDNMAFRTYFCCTFTFAFVCSFRFPWKVAANLCNAMVAGCPGSYTWISKWAVW